MDNYFNYIINRICIGGISILNKRYLLYGYGKTIKAVKQYFDMMNIEYIVYFETDDEINVVEEVFRDIDFIVKSPGIKFEKLFLVLAKKNKIKVISDLELVYLLYPNYEYIVVTGSNGKTTTTYLISQILKNYPLFKKGMVGNIGIPIFENIDNNRLRRGFVVEASSFMLHNTYNLKASVYILTNLVPHHLDYHFFDDDYYRDKTKLLENMNEHNYLVYNLDDENIVKYVDKYNKPIKYTVSLYNKEATCYLNKDTIYYLNKPFLKKTELLKSDNATIYDMMLSIVVSKIYHIDIKKIKEVLTNFSGLSFRLEKIYDDKELIIYNDSKATSPYATLEAIKYVNNKYQDYYKIAILGGKIVDSNYELLKNEIREFDIVYLYGSSRHLINELIGFNVTKIYETLEEVVDNFTYEKKTIVLFSPSCVSYDQFNSFEDRGKKFNQLINDKF